MMAVVPLARRGSRGAGVTTGNAGAGPVPAGGVPPPGAKGAGGAGDTGGADGAAGAGATVAEGAAAGAAAAVAPGPAGAGALAAVTGAPPAGTAALSGSGPVAGAAVAMATGVSGPAPGPVAGLAADGALNGVPDAAMKALAATAGVTGRAGDAMTLTALPVPAAPSVPAPLPARPARRRPVRYRPVRRPAVGCGAAGYRAAAGGIGGREGGARHREADRRLPDRGGGDRRDRLRRAGKGTALPLDSLVNVRRMRPQSLDERVNMTARLGDARHLQRLEDDRAVGAPGHRRQLLAGPAEHRREHRLVQAAADPASVQQRAVHVPEHEEIAHETPPNFTGTTTPPGRMPTGGFPRAAGLRHGNQACRLTEVTGLRRPVTLCPAAPPATGPRPSQGTAAPCGEGLRLPFPCGAAQISAASRTIPARRNGFWPPPPASLTRHPGSVAARG